jgi:hypothetical protein
VIEELVTLSADLVQKVELARNIEQEKINRKPGGLF